MSPTPSTSSFLTDQQIAILESVPPYQLTLRAIDLAFQAAKDRKVPTPSIEAIALASVAGEISPLHAQAVADLVGPSRMSIILLTQETKELRVALDALPARIAAALAEVLQKAQPRAQAPAGGQPSRSSSKQAASAVHSSSATPERP